MLQCTSTKVPKMASDLRFIDEWRRKTTFLKIEKKTLHAVQENKQFRRAKNVFAVCQWSALSLETWYVLCVYENIPT